MTSNRILDTITGVSANARRYWRDKLSSIADHAEQTLSSVSYSNIEKLWSVCVCSGISSRKTWLDEVLSSLRFMAPDTDPVSHFAILSANVVRSRWLEVL